MNRRSLLLLAAAFPAAASLQASAQREPAVPVELATELPTARLQGSARLRFLGLTVYDARLWTGRKLEGRDEADGWAEVPLALELEYARAVSSEQIAERSLVEMRRQATISDGAATRWLAALRRAVPDVARGDRLTGSMRPGRGTRFFHNGSLRGEVVDAEFTRLFFGIWLAPQTSEPGLRAKLLGLAA